MSRRTSSRSEHSVRPASPLELRVFAQFLTPLCEQEWQRELSAPAPNWTFLLWLHMRLIHLDQDQ